MKITICGSISNASKIYAIEKELASYGHEVFSHELMHQYATGDQNIIKKVSTDHSSLKRDNDTFKWYYNAIKASDAILVCNFEKNNIKNYIGGSVLMEIGYAHVLDKKIFFLNPIPDVSFKDELIAASPAILNGDLNKIQK
ncbi:MAG: hypothetical protein UT48_C0008G0017 [Parcubacteria group bacterium GW2011_GWE2_39_37]|uniref:Maf-like protein n=1 Tax=Candidatus Falkowbacteria bacterium GW2011_GWF2_39_8 TaxID=1618642 RepID=A0A0G0PTY3_9BACT|nr:MAG: hypothetical protein UT48_C0008G0017 [Parcubacteria group bacterium GW2011_GWE2_39_37]KKR31373.1 MAG: hypothetical protein UT64_C0062G0004 [Candidatus Falkowbacteria bacterium GW2011_GWF2_39_8]